MKKRYIVFLLLICMFGSGLAAQSLEKNEYYKKSVEYADLSRKAIDNGEYERGSEYAIESLKYAELSKQYIAQMLMAYRARSAYVAAKARVTIAERLNIPSRDKNLWTDVSVYFQSATEKFNAEDYEQSIPDSVKVVELLRDIESKYQAALAASYTVKLNPARRDCLWRIAGFDFVYGDSRQWQRLYEANKDTFPDPRNPDLIRPGQVLKIPSIRGEARSGSR
ncbi:MAG: LysM peptidoglycan-binding domain-containing protein [Treponema sp.]|jgi:nucleoid-associated protein YgaU|nr:LysM peptidoglycan-binding domain-containing protein [Treponema sp.]